ncbi:MAG TPA: DUF4369 domain-containing protein [Flavobacterium sp.]|nr:DUF4369 domain-containing protein [Flavobacterium sp.]
MRLKIAIPVVILSALLLLAGCQEKKSTKNLQITGNIEGFKKGTIYIQKLEDTTLVPLDSIIVNGDSHFASDIDIDSPQMLYIFIDRGVSNSLDNNLMFFAEPGKINIDTNLDYFYSNAKITGSKNQEFYEEYKKVNSRFVSQQLELTEAKLKAMQKSLPYSEEENQAKSEAILKSKYLYAINFAVNHKDYEVAPYVALSEINDANLKYLDTIQKSLSPKVARSKYGKLLEKHIAERRKLEQQ